MQHSQFFCGLARRDGRSGRSAPAGCGRVLAVALFATILSFVLVGSGCTSVPSYETLQATRAELPAPAPGVEADGRARFRDIFCTLAQHRNVPQAQRGSSCQRLLWRLADEPRPGTFADLPALDPQLQFLVVGGAFSDCFGPASVAYRRAIEGLTEQGFRVGTIAISGRSSAEHNAQMMADALAVAPAGPLVLLGYSKGTVDIFYFLNAYPELAQRVVAVISVAGPIFGSEVAERGAWVYDNLLAGALPGRCDPGDEGVVDSLLPRVRRDWLARNPPPPAVRYYSLLAFTTREHIARALLPSWEILAPIDLRNDGQLTVGEGTLPGSTLLGYANSDHWGIAIDIEEELSFWADRPDETPFPRSVLFEAALRYVSEDLRQAGAIRETPVTEL